MIDNWSEWVEINQRRQKENCLKDGFSWLLFARCVVIEAC